MEKGNINIDVRSENINENGEDKVLLYFEISTKTNANEISLPEDIQQSIERLLRTATRLITLMGGEILLEESLSIETETRTTFSFNIKLESHVDSSRELLTVGDATKKLHGKRILIVDDSPTNLKLLDALLRRNGMQTKTAINGLEAFNTLKDDPNFDLVLMDLQMPVMDGLEATQKIRGELEFKAPILALSGNNPAESKDQSLQAGMNAFAQKPCGTNQFPLMWHLISQHQEEKDEEEQSLKAQGLQKLCELEDGFASAFHVSEELDSHRDSPRSKLAWGVPSKDPSPKSEGFEDYKN